MTSALTMKANALKTSLRRLLPPPLYGAGQRIMQSRRALAYAWKILGRLQREQILSALLSDLPLGHHWRDWLRICRLHAQELDKLIQARQRSWPGATLAPPANQPTVTIVLLSFNRWHLTKRCLESIYAHSHYPFQVLIFDNGSHEETLAYLRAAEASYANLHVLYHPTNLGVAGGRNRAFAAVQTDYLFSLDNDMICHSNWLNEIMRCAQQTQSAFVCPFILQPDGRIWAGGADLVRIHATTHDNTKVEIYPWFHSYPLGQVQRLLKQGYFRTDFLFGGAGLYRLSAFRHCEGLANYFVGWEDIDFSFRLQEKGYTVWVTPQALLTHDHEWEPQTAADQEYRRVRYDEARLRQSAAQFEQRWGIKVAY
jgi:GT2 family glycosyltransferase